MAEQRITFCRLCEPLCGLVATVEDDRVLKLAPDPDNPLSQGFVCPKGIAFTEIQNSPERVLNPLRRKADGEFEQVSWDEALGDIGRRLRAIWEETGPESIAFYLGNPTAFSYSATLGAGGFGGALGPVKTFSPGSQDTNSRWLASHFLYGAINQTPFPDLPRTDFLLMIGANPLVSHGGLIRAPRIREDLAAIVKRGGRVVVLDPRRSETARAYEHVAIRPDTDAWLLLSMLHVIFAEGLTDERAIAEQTSGVQMLREAAATHAPEITEPVTGVPAATVRTLAQDFATARSAAAYGRTGACLGRHATLVNFLIDALAIVTGNLDRPGGTLFAQSAIPLDEIGVKVGQVGYGLQRSRIGDFPDVIGSLPGAVLADEITTPGPGQVRAFVCTAGNPVVSLPNGDALAQALPQLDLFVSLDYFVTETNRHADYVLPAATWLERDDFQLLFAAAAPRPFLQHTEAMVSPAGEARSEWDIYSEIARRAGFAMFVPGTSRRLSAVLNRIGSRAAIKPGTMIDAILRLGPYGDRFGLRRGGLNARKLATHRHGLMLADHAPTGLLRDVVTHPGNRVRLDPPEMREALRRLVIVEDPEFPLRMIGLREMRSLNSWMQRSPTLMKGERHHRALLNPADASAAGVTDGERVCIISATGSLETMASVTDDLAPGTVAIPHGWGEANSNQLTSRRLEDIEPFAGMSHLNGVPVRIEKGS